MPLLVPAGASKVVGMDGDFGEMRPFSGSEETCLDGGKMLHHVTSYFFSTMGFPVQNPKWNGNLYQAAPNMALTWLSLTSGSCGGCPPSRRSA